MTTPVSRELTQGHVIGEYTVHSCLCKSNASIIYKALGRDDTAVIIKEFYPLSFVTRNSHGVLKLNESRNAEKYSLALSRFVQIGNTLSKISHSAIITVHGVQSANNTAYMVMRYEDAVTLTEVLSYSSVLEYQDLTSIIFPVLEAFRIIHKNHVLHLSISADDILIGKEGNPIICGFGSFVADLQAGEGIAEVNRPDYAAIEMFSKKAELIGPWSDIYSLGAVFFQCISGSKPPPAIKRYESIKQHGVDPIADISTQYSEKYSARLLAAVDQALLLKPKDRPKSIAEWTREILELSSEENAPVRAPAADLDQTLGTGLTATESKPSRPEGDPVDMSETQRKLVRSYIGGKNQLYYMAAFMQQEARGYVPVASVNISALLFGIVWMCYRKMYLWALFAMPLVILITGAITYYVVQENLSFSEYLLLGPGIDLTALITFVLVSLFLGLYGNYLYFLQISMYLAKARKHCPAVSMQRKYLSKAGFVSKTAAAGAFFLLGVLAYAGYLTLSERDKFARAHVSEAITALDLTSRKVNGFRKTNARWPENNREISSNTGLSGYRYVGDISIVKQLIVVTFKDDAEVMPQMAGKSMALFGTENSTGNGSKWICGSINVALEYMPVRCRRYLR